MVVVHTYHKHLKYFFASFTCLFSYSHFYIHVIYLFSIIHFIFTSYRPCSVTLPRDWIISYLSSLLNLRFVYTTLYITHTLHTYFPWRRTVYPFEILELPSTFYPVFAVLWSLVAVFLPSKWPNIFKEKGSRLTKIWQNTIRLTSILPNVFL